MSKVSSQFNIDRFYTPKMRELRIQPYKDKSEAAKVEVEKSAATLEALTTLDNLQTRMQNAILPFSRGKTGVFDQRQAGILTSDVGNGSDYINVITAPNATKGQFTVRVDQLAKAASMVVNKTLGGFGAAEDLATTIGGANPKITIGFPGAEGGLFVVDINPTDNISNLATNINNAFQLSGAPLTATASQRSDGDYSLVIKNSHTGSGSFTCVFSSDAGAYATTNTYNRGADANVVVDGFAKSSRSNNINDVAPGVSIQLKKLNDPKKDLTVNVTEGGPQIVQRLEEIVNAYNSFLDFADIQSKTTVVNGFTVPADDAVLYNSRSLNTAVSNIKAIVGLVPGLSGEISSLHDIGIEIDKATNRLGFPDNNKLLNAISNNFDGIKNLFRNSATITKIGPTTADLKFSDIVPGTVLPRSVTGAPITINDDGVGNITFSLNGGAAKPAILNGSTISFSNTELAGVILTYNKTGVGAESFNVVISQGIADRFRSQALPFETQIAREITSLNNEAKELQEKEKIADEALKKAETDLDKEIMTLDLQLLMFDEEMDNLDIMLEGILGN